ncbi:AhpC/TSA family protein [Flavobacterium sp. 9]|uniref:TlpA family protein disulfide reductase n=1 Tax=Flavobacterium sp. 9 TaxID=2035198 RepID=UPI000C181284|nr:TlpA disulfide reductase family protein [Flavobacterium sp. 9]PIF30109.1 AhpC/TSA family protein [Flavobacterium sp. 9]
MKKKMFLFLTLMICVSVYSQILPEKVFYNDGLDESWNQKIKLNQRPSKIMLANKKAKIQGDIISNKDINDTINFSWSTLGENYYSVKKLSSVVLKNKFILNFNLDYPQMYALSFSSEKNTTSFRVESFFIDNTTTKIKFNSEYKLESSDGDTNIEFIEKFIPNVFNGSKKYPIPFNFNDEDDARLFDYIKNNPNSYVALWFLVGRFNQQGYTELYEKCLKSFSKKIKEERLWGILNNEFQTISIKENHKFPELVLQNTDLQKSVLKIPTAKFTLIEIWFSRCRPCLDQIPLWKDLYNKYNSAGFNIIGISTDHTKDVDIWKKRILEKEIPWKQYLDEDALIASREKIFSFPSNFLLNEKGVVIKKNIKPQDLVLFLNENIKK